VNGNLLPFISLLEIAAAAAVKKIAFVSSAGTVYGTTSGRVAEDHDKKPYSPYGIIKLTMENFLRHYETRLGLKYDIFRVSNVYGEGQDTGKGLGIINTFLEGIVSHGEVVVYGDGSSTRNYIYVKDVAKIMKLSLTDLTRSDVYNVSSPSTLDIRGLLNLMKEVIPDEFSVRNIESRQSDNPYIDLDNSRLRSRMGNFEFMDIRMGILNTYHHIKQEIIKQQ
jgi:UDP-glucose 4-epimerase